MRCHGIFFLFFLCLSGDIFLFGVCSSNYRVHIAGVCVFCVSESENDFQFSNDTMKEEAPTNSRYDEYILHENQERSFLSLRLSIVVCDCR